MKVERNVHNLRFILRCTGRIDVEKREKSSGKIRERTPEKSENRGLLLKTMIVSSTCEFVV